MKRVFLDTSAFYALEGADDVHHAEAQAIQGMLRECRLPLFTTHDVIDETITLLGARLGVRCACRFASKVFDSRILSIVRADANLDAAALRLYERFGDQRLSFTDCLSFAVMRILGIRQAFAFDRHFEVAGFELLRGDDA